MGQTIKRNCNCYTLDFKLQAINLANHPNVTAMDIAESPGIHPVMLYRWRLEKKNGALCENKIRERQGTWPPVMSQISVFCQ